MVEPSEDKVTFDPAANWLIAGCNHTVAPPAALEAERVSELDPARTMFVPLTVDEPAVLPDRVMYWLWTEFQSAGRTRFVAATVVVFPSLLNTVTVPVKSATVFDFT
jgi:hypothetical protein